MHQQIHMNWATVDKVITNTGTAQDQNIKTLTGVSSKFAHRVIYTNSGTLGASSTGTYALVTDSGWTVNSQVWIRSSQLVIGCGGLGGTGANVTSTDALNDGAAGASGGPALNVGVRTFLDNSSGRIYGGGGGGGGGGSRPSIPGGFPGVLIGGAGGGGGNGAGWPVPAGRAGGTGNISNDATSPPGTWTAVQAGSGGVNSISGGGTGGSRTSCIYGTGGTGGAGGGVGAAGGAGGGEAGGLGSIQGASGGGGAAGNYIVGVANVIWLSTGTVAGGVS